MNRLRVTSATAACAAVCFLLASFLLGSCRPADRRGLLWYQETMTAATLTENGRAWRVGLLPDGFTAALTAPPALAGICFTVSGEEASVSGGETVLPAAEAMLQSARRAAACVSLSEEALTGISRPGKDDEWSALAHFSTEDARYDLAIGKDGLPLWILEYRGSDVRRWTVSVEGIS